MPEIEVIGGSEPGPIRIVDYDAQWPQHFEAERARIAAALSARPTLIEHIGSTAVPGLAAKPIIDVLVAVDDVEDQGAYREALEAAGYALRIREPGHRMFRTAARDIHVHLWAAGSADVQRHLRFRDLLRQSAADRERYERAKRDLAARSWTDTNDYAQAKTAIISTIMDRPG
ncbi:MAG TPA: GrpB family protein [Candidatus Tumulicola sp.]|nr:GrpB family protein [Candidatus Tumulicola sp.]